MRRQSFLADFPTPSGYGRWWADAKGVYVDKSIAAWFGYKTKTLYIPFQSPGPEPVLGPFLQAIQHLLVSQSGQASISCDVMPSGLPGHFRIETVEINDPLAESAIYGFLIDVSEQVGLGQQIDLMLAENQWVVDQHQAIIQADAAETTRCLLRLEMGFGYAWIVDVESQKLRPDDAFAAWAGAEWRAGSWYPVEEMMQSIPADFHDEFRRLLEANCKNLAEGDTFSFEHPQFRMDIGELRWVKVFGKLSIVGGRKEIHGVVIDITEQHAKQCRLEQLAQRQKELFGIIGHELLTPIAALQMHLQTIDSDNTTRTLVKQALKVTDRMQRVVNNSKALPGMRKATRPVEVIQRLLAQFQEEHSHCRLRFEFDEGMAPKELMLCLEDFEAFVSAALADATGQAQSDILVTCSLECAKSDVQLVITVNDDRQTSEHGIVRGSDVGAELGNVVSFGLLEIEMLVDRLGGTYQINEGKQGRVLTFKADVLGAAAQQVMDLSPSNLLIVEDDPFLVVLIRRMLESGGHQVTSAANGKEAIDYLQSNQFDAVLTDLSMPFMNGHDLIRWIRERDADLPIGVLTASVLGSEIAAAVDLGANLALQKPVERDALLESINQLLNRRRSADLPCNQSQ